MVRRVVGWRAMHAVSLGQRVHNRRSDQSSGWFYSSNITERPPLGRAGSEGEKQMMRPKRSAEQQVADEVERRALHPLSSRQTISDSQAEPEFQANHRRLRAERLAREAEPKAKRK
jgi:hypothetical protein